MYVSTAIVRIRRNNNKLYTILLHYVYRTRHVGTRRPILSGVVVVLVFCLGPDATTANLMKSADFLPHTY